MNQDYTDIIQQVSQVLLQAIKEREFNLAQNVDKLDSEFRREVENIAHLALAYVERRLLVLETNFKVSVVHGEDQIVRLARTVRSDSLAEDDRGFQVGRRHLHDAQVVARRDVAVEPPSEILVERLRAVNDGNAEHHDFELHVWIIYVIAVHLVLL